MITKIKAGLIVIILTIAHSSYAQQKKAQATTIAQRDAKVEALIAKMTPEEKAGQLHFIVGETIITGPTFYTSTSDKFDDLIRQGKITGLFNVHGAAYTGKLQKIAVEQSRLHIPLLFGADIIHGFKTVTPLPLGESA